MRVQLKDVFPNPYRDMKNYPINRDKVEQLKKSIEQSGFWDNILARKFESEKVQIAYGHHRLTALKEMYPDDHWIEIPVKNLDNATMLQIMANENMTDWKAGPEIIDETVKAAKEFLESNTDVAKKYGDISKNPKHVASTDATSIGADIISKFLDWNESKVRFSLQRLESIKNNEVDEESLHSMPTDNMSRVFLKHAKDKTHGVNKEKQKIVAKKVKEKIAKGESVGEKEIASLFKEQKWALPPKAKPEPTEQVKKYGEFIFDIRKKLEAVEIDLMTFIKLEKELGVIDHIERHLLNTTVNNVQNKLSQISKIYQNEKDIVKSTNS